MYDETIRSNVSLECILCYAMPQTLHTSQRHLVALRRNYNCGCQRRYTLLTQPWLSAVCAAVDP